MIQLYIANKNYSSWSMRPWVLLRQAGIDFEEVFVRFDSFAPDSQFKAALKDVNPVGKVPVLVHDGLAVWDTLAIAEYVAEQFPDKQLWPQERAARARARSICAEMHSGFMGLRPNPSCRTLRVPTYKMTCLTHFKLQRAGSIICGYRFMEKNNAPALHCQQKLFVLVHAPLGAAAPGGHSL